MNVIAEQIRACPYLKYKTQPRFHPISLCLPTDTDPHHMLTDDNFTITIIFTIINAWTNAL